MCDASLFKALLKVWDEYNKTQEEKETPADVLTYIELVLDHQDQLCELNRLQGENEVNLIDVVFTIVIIVV